MKKASLGKKELKLLHYINECEEAVSVREVTDDYGKKHDLARTTILTTMENLREKGYLDRKRPGNVYKYFPKQTKKELMKGLVKDFVNNSLKGSLSPFVTYLSEEKELQEEEIKELKNIIEKIDKKDD